LNLGIYGNGEDSAYWPSASGGIGFQPVPVAVLLDRFGKGQVSPLLKGWMDQFLVRFEQGKQPARTCARNSCFDDA